MYDIIVVGAGPAGLTAALYARRANKSILVLEARNYGGQILNASIVENYPAIPSITGYDYATALYNQVKDLGAEIKFETVIRVDEDKKVYTNDNEYQATAVILAIGCENRKLGLPRETEFVGKGISYCATCDGPLYKNKNVAVIGGGNTALEDAIYLSGIAKHVYLIHRRDEFRGEVRYQNKLKNIENVEFIMNSNVKDFIGEDKIEGIVLEDKDGNLNKIKVSGVFVAVGQQPNNEVFTNVATLNSTGYIESSDGVHTNVDGIYVAGDARVKELRQLTTAVADGSIAATVAIKEMR